MCIRDSGSQSPVALGAVSASDPDGDILSYAIAGGNSGGLFAIDENTGALTYVGSGEDYETAPNTYALTVRVTDPDGASDTVAVTVSVTDESEDDPTIASSPMFDPGHGYPEFTGDGASMDYGIPPRDFAQRLFEEALVRNDGFEADAGPSDPVTPTVGGNEAEPLGEGYTIVTAPDVMPTGAPDIGV